MKWFFLFYTKKIERQIGVVFFRIMSERDFNFMQLQVSSVSSTEEEQKQPPEVFIKKGVQDISQNSQENTCARASGLQLY